MKTQPILRFAPSPNGFLHLGHAFSALTVWAMAARLGGVALLRIEDIDVVRCKPEFDVAAREDLAWLGLDWPEPVLRQSDRFAAYAEAARTLEAMGVLYRCFCSRKEVAQNSIGTDPDGAPLYGHTCRDMGALSVVDLERSGAVCAWRLHMAKAREMVGPIPIRHWTGTDVPKLTMAEPEVWGDAVIVRKDTPTTYHLSVVIDDAAQGVSHVTRGMDLERATDIQRLLQVLLGLPDPHYFHHDLIRDEGDNKLAKSRGSTSLRDLRAAGWTPERVRRHLGF